MKRPKPRVRSALALLLACAAGPLAAGGSGLPQPLAPFTASYQVTDGSSRVGRAEFGLEPAKSGWRYHSRVKPEGLYALLIGEAEDTAWLETHGNGLRPLRYIHDEDGKEDDVRMTFDWAADQALVEHGDNKRTLALEPGTHDQFSAMLAVMQAFANGQQRLELPSIDDDGTAEPLVFVRDETVSVKTPFGSFDAVHVRRVRENSKRETESWLAPSIGWIPVRIEQRKKGELVARMELIGRNGDNADLSVDNPR